MVVPSVYFIDSTSGVDLEITGGKVIGAHHTIPELAYLNVPNVPRFAYLNMPNIHRLAYLNGQFPISGLTNPPPPPPSGIARKSDSQETFQQL